LGLKQRQRRDFHPREVTAGELPHEINRSSASTGVDGVDLIQEGDRLPNTEFLRPMAECPDVLRQAPPPKPSPGLRNRAPMRSS